MLIAAFSDWKVNQAKFGPGDERAEAYEFAKDAFNRGSKVCRHVHMVPIGDDGSLIEWNENWENYRKRTSDRILFYANGDSYGYLLIQIVDDPGGHGVFSDKGLLAYLEAVADAFVFHGKLPA